MKTNGKYVEHYGHLKKVESLSSISSPILEGTMVLDAPEPFPGCSKYYGEMPRHSKPLYVYLVLNEDTDLEKFARANQAVAKSFGEAFNGAFSSIEINHDQMLAIRVRHLKSYELIEPLQKAYIEEGVCFKHGTKMYKGDAFLTFKKLFQLKQYEDGIYCDQEEKDHGYFTIPKVLKQPEFEELIKRVKNNTNLQSYDFAHAFFYTEQKIVDVIRVYNPTMNPEVVAQVKKEVISRM